MTEKKKNKAWLVWILPAVLLVTFGLVVLDGSNKMNQAQAKLDKQEEQIDSLSAELAMYRDQLETQHEDAVTDITGVNQERFANDSEIGENLMRVAATWSSGDEYIEARNRIMRAYGLTEDSEFLTTFLPGEEQGAFRVDDSGEVHFAYPNANARLQSFDPVLISMDGDSWSYFAAVQIEMTASNDGTARRYIAVNYTVDGDGNVTGIMGYPSNNIPDVTGVRG